MAALKILHLHYVNKGEITDIKNKISSPQFNLTITASPILNSTLVNNTDVIVIGIGDYEVDISKSLNYLINARNAGKGILFTHAAPMIYPNLIGEYTEAEYNQWVIDKDTYYNNLRINFGIDSLEENHQYIFYSSARIKNASHQIVTAPFNAGTSPATIETTHTLGWFLTAGCTILLDNPAEPVSRKNFYLGLFEETGKGRVAHCQCGHNKYGVTTWKGLAVNEYKLLANLILWLKG